MNLIFAKIRRMIVSILMMFLTSLFTLGGLSVLVERLDWYAEAALVGITFVYVLAGFSGGLSFGVFDKDTEAVHMYSGNAALYIKLMKGILIGCIFMLFLLGTSLGIRQESASNLSLETDRILPVWLLVSCSSGFGAILPEILGKNGKKAFRN